MTTETRVTAPDPRPTQHNGHRADGLVLFMFSTFRVVVNGTPLNVRLGAKALPLLKILAAHRGRGLTRDALMEMLWPGTDPTAGAVSLKVAAHNLRSLLEPSKEYRTQGQWILFDNGTYTLNPDAPIWIDVECMEQHWRRGLADQASGELDAARCEFDAAERLYIGDYLEEDIYENWTIVRRERLRDVYLEVVGKLLEFAVRDGDHPAAIRYCHKIVDADPCREDAYRVLMQSHASLKQRARAGAWYAVCRTMLKTEMAVDPSPETVAVFESLFDDLG